LNIISKQISDDISDEEKRNKNKEDVDGIIFYNLLFKKLCADQAELSKYFTDTFLKIYELVTPLKGRKVVGAPCIYCPSVPLCKEQIIRQNFTAVQDLEFCFNKLVPYIYMQVTSMIGKLDDLSK